MNNSKYHMNIGGASIILLVTVFALTLFAVLSIRASYNEKQMAQRGRDAVEHYYEADAKAEEAYAKIRNAFLEAGNAGGGWTMQSVLEAAGLSPEVAAEIEGNCIVCHIGVDHNRVLRVVLELSGACVVKEWRLLSNAYGNYDEVTDLWDGVFQE